MSGKGRAQAGRVLYLVVALLALVNGGCLVVAAGAAAGGAAAAGYFYFKGRLYRDYPSTLGDSLAAVHTGLSELRMVVVTEEQDAAKGTAFVESRTGDGSKVRIYLETVPSRIPVEGPMTRISIRVGTVGDEAVTVRVLDQVGSHLVVPGQTPLVPQPAPAPIQPTAATRPAETPPPPLAAPVPVGQRLGTLTDFPFAFASPAAITSAGMSQPPPLAVPPLRPTLVDYFLLLAGFGLSLYLARLGPLPAVADPSVTQPGVQDLVDVLPGAMRLPEGVLLLWPLLFATQRIRGRSQGLTTGEWLWVLAWVGTVLLTGLGVCRYNGWLPSRVESHAGAPLKLWYLIVMPSMAALAVCFLLLGLVRRAPPPWTHPLSLVLIIWPVLPLAGILALGKFAPTAPP